MRSLARRLFALALALGLVSGGLNVWSAAGATGAWSDVFAALAWAGFMVAFISAVVLALLGKG